MPYTKLKHKIKDFTVGNFFYDLSLKDWFLSDPATDHKDFVVMLSNPWTGNIESGRWICNGSFTMNDQQIDYHEDYWEPLGVSEAWIDHMHGFTWLRDLQTLGGDQARRQARSMIGNWMESYQRCHPKIWSAGLTGKRVANWLELYSFYGDCAGDDFQNELVSSIHKQVKHLSRQSAEKLFGLDSFYMAQALIYAGLCLFEREYLLEQGLDVLEKTIDAQILPDGGHISRCPQTLLTTLQILVSIKSAISTGQYPVPAGLESTITKTSQALRFFRHTDKKLALFNGTQESTVETLDMVLQKANAKGKILKCLPNSQYERMVLGRSLVMVDAGMPAPHPRDSKSHAAPLSFEFSYGRERIFVNCGTNQLDDDWSSAMRATAAHNMLTVDHRNVCEVMESGHFGRKPKKVTCERDYKPNALLLELTHDGYLPLNGIIHRRRLYLGEQGHDLRGEESLTCATGLSKTHSIELRFHIHPRVMVSLVQGDQEALFKLQGGAGWRFMFNGQELDARLSLENSIYLGEGTRPRKTKQLVIRGMMHQDFTQLKWCLKREKT
jgi:uncharacterized heparinase superfamily protein